MYLTDILPHLEVRKNSVLKRACIDSRLVKAGDLFICLPPLDGRDVICSDHIREAVEKGAVAVLARPQDWPSEADPTLRIDSVNPRLDLALLSRRIYPQQPMYMVGVTGTNGKSSVVGFCRQIWDKAQLRSCALGSLGIIGSVNQDFAAQGNINTPNPLTLHHVLQTLTLRHITHLAMEVTSHGLDQYRVDGVNFEAAAFTNLSQDHLDYHGNMEAYFQAKLRLFKEVLPVGKSAVVNADSSYAPQIIETCKARQHALVRYGRGGEELKIVSLKAYASGYEVGLESYGNASKIYIPLLGEFQIYNALCALGLCLATGLELHKGLRALESLESVQGRMMLVGATENEAAVYVDYAHTPEALEVALKGLRDHCRNKIWLVFGCGGNRDTDKRSKMGKIAAQQADHVVITDDNPRYEDPAVIRAQVRQGCPKAEEVGNRYQAIEYAMAHAQKGDLIVIAGKGHESAQYIKDEVIPFNDGDAVRRILMAQRHRQDSAI